MARCSRCGETGLLGRTRRTLAGYGACEGSVSWTLHLGDCLDPVTGLASLADKSVDVVITDPPYSEHVHAKARSGAMAKAAAGLKGASISIPVDLGFEHITQAQIESIADQCARLARRWVLVFCDVESAHLWAGALRSTGGLEYIRTCAWDKTDGAPQFTGDRPATWGEAIVCAHPKGRKRWNGGGKRGLYSHATAKAQSGPDSRVHTTQKPVGLMEDLIRDFTEEGETILDPFAGGGTTGLAALRLNRNFIGWERDANYHAIATERLKNGGTLPTAFHDERQGVLLR